MADSVSTEAWLDQRRWAALLSYGLYVLLLAGALCSIMLAGKAVMLNGICRII